MALSTPTPGLADQTQSQLDRNIRAVAKYQVMYFRSGEQVLACRSNEFAWGLTQMKENESLTCGLLVVLMYGKM